MRFSIASFRAVARALALSTLTFPQLAHASPQTASPPSAWPPPGIIGYWSGEGRLAFREGKFENVRCRVTYFADQAAAANLPDLKQTVRCATAGAKIEVKSVIKGSGGALTGTWEETVYNLKGDISGQATERGFRVEVRSDALSANMDLLLKDKQQMIELQFFNSTLMGLTIMLTKGSPSAAAQ
jgi:hypothetical protein